jgi:hypothetical protein
VIGSQWSEERAIELGRRVLRDNVELIFPKPKSIDRTVADELRTQRATTDETWIESDPSADGDASSFETVRIEDAPANSAETLDPLPSEDEIKAVDLDDVELLTGNAAITDHETLAADVDLEPLDVGDLTGDADDEGAEKIQMLRGDGSFEADEESLKVKPDPMTGELRFPNPSEKDETELPGTETDEYDTLGDESIQ